MAERSGRPRVLITGGTGLLATNWACAVRETWDVMLATHTRSVALPRVESAPIALVSPATLAREIDDWRPTLIVHAAGLTDVDRCEADPDLAEAINVKAAVTVARAAKAGAVPLVHISTDHLFAGDQALVDEDQPVAPLNEYARSKWQAEQRVREVDPDALIVRTNFFGWGHACRRSFSDWILATLRAGQPLLAFDDVYFSPTLVDRVAVDVHALAARGCSGVFNVCGDERISKYDFVERIASVFHLPMTFVRRASVDEAGLRARRPRDMSLSTGRVRATLGRPERTVLADLQQLLRQDAAGRRVELWEAVR